MKAQSNIKRNCFYDAAKREFFSHQSSSPELVFTSGCVFAGTEFGARRYHKIPDRFQALPVQVTYTVDILPVRLSDNPSPLRDLIHEQYVILETEAGVLTITHRETGTVPPYRIRNFGTFMILEKQSWVDKWPRIGVGETEEELLKKFIAIHNNSKKKIGPSWKPIRFQGKLFDPVKD